LASDDPTSIKNEDAALGRIAALSDGVIAFAITLMVLDVRVPDNLLAGQVGQALLDLRPKYFGCALSFVVIAVYWIEHHRMFTRIVRYDRRLIWLNFLFLFFIAFLPFTTDIIGEYGNVPIVVAVYAALGAAVGFSKEAIWWYASHNHRLIDPEMSQQAVNRSLVAGLIAPVVFLASLAIVPLSSDAAMYSWLMMMPLKFLAHRAT